MEFLTRSWLCVPALKYKHGYDNSDFAADVVILDLEDSTPVGEKSEARMRLGERVKAHTNVEILSVRINALSSVEGLRDVIFLLENDIFPDIILVPKIESAGELNVLDAILQRSGKKPQVFAIIETLRGLTSIDKIVSSNVSLHGIILGSADMSAQLSFSISNKFLEHVKYEMAVAAISENIIAIDAPCFNLGCEETLRRELMLAKEFGFSGKIAIHPRQLKIINECFTPNQHELERAEKVMGMVGDRGTASTIGVLDNSMVGPPFAIMAAKLIKRHGMINSRGAFHD
jgi:citrate lyase beta subunit